MAIRPTKKLAIKNDRELATMNRRVNVQEREVPESDWDGIRDLPYKRQTASGFAPRQEKYRNVICGLLKILELGHIKVKAKLYKISNHRNEIGIK